MASARFSSAQQVFAAFPTMADDVVAGPADMAPLEFLTMLSSSDTPEDAITFAAYMLDRREAVWWAAQCIRQMGSPENREEEVALLTAEAWVRDPEEHRRVAALNLGLSGNHKLPATWAALAAGGAGGTMVTGAHAGPPVPGHLCAKAARSSVLIALARMPLRERQGYIGQCATLCKTLYTRQ